MKVNDILCGVETMAKTKTTKAKTAVTAAGLLGSIGTKPTATSKSDTPIVVVSDQKQLKIMRKIILAKRAYASAASAVTTASEELRDQATKLFEDKCRADEMLHTSIQLVGELETDDGTQTQSVSYTQMRKCCKMSEADVSDPLHLAFGSDFDKLFAPERTIEIDTSVLTEKQIVALVEAMQTALEDNFDSAVTVESLILPKEVFYRDRILDDKIRKIAARAKDDGYAIPTKAYFKAK